MNKNESKLTALLALTAFTLFSVCILVVLLTGAEGYRKLTEQGEADHARRTAAGYLTTRVRQAEAVRTEGFGGCDALVLEETVDGERYLTRVYCHGGWLRELYTARGSTVSPEDGEKLLEAQKLTLSRKDSLLQTELTLNGGETLVLQLQIPTAQEVGP